MGRCHAVLLSSSCWPVPPRQHDARVVIQQTAVNRVAGIQIIGGGQQLNICIVVVTKMIDP